MRKPPKLSPEAAALRDDGIQQIERAILRAKFGPGETWHKVAATAAFDAVLAWLKAQEQAAKIAKAAA